MPPTHATILADGDPCSAKLLRRLRRGRFTIVLDGAAERARRERWRPSLLAGDFDAVRPATLRFFARGGVPLLHLPDQNHTDLEKALAWCVGQNAKSVWIAQSQGGRVDHSFVNLALLKRFHSPAREIVVFQDQETIRYVENERLLLRGSRGRLVAVLPFPGCRVHSRGLAFEMRGLALELGTRESACNQARTARVELKIRGAALVVEGQR